MKKYYISNTNELNHEELRSGYISYRKLIKRYISNLVLCNNIAQDECFNENFYEELSNMFTRLDEATQEEYNNDPFDYYEGLEVFQYYITDCNDYEVEALRELNNELIVYNDSLDCYILCVTHYGTSWDYVMSNVQWSTDWSEC
ncbi:hypothetical protein [Methanobrevibacter sp.]|uniref:hypothetical protein n=1 Tax=Methanobrevibacter sp. TaxID=66852 RepID=UPI00388DDC80